jgi:hypothetical protein
VSNLHRGDITGFVLHDQGVYTAASLMYLRTSQIRFPTRKTRTLVRGRSLKETRLPAVTSSFRETTAVSRSNIYDVVPHRNGTSSISIR